MRRLVFATNSGPLESFHLVVYARVFYANTWRSTHSCKVEAPWRSTIAAFAQHKSITECSTQAHWGLRQRGNSVSSRKYQNRRDGNTVDKGSSGDGDPGNNGITAPSGDENTGHKNISSGDTDSSSEESDWENDPASDSDSGSDSETNERMACPCCVHLAASVVQFHCAKKGFTNSNDSECCNREIDQCMRLLYQTRRLILEKNPQLEPDLEAHSTLHLRGTGCPDCETVATSVIQFHGTKKELDFRHCEGCVYIISQSIALLQLTGDLVALRSCHHAKVKRKGARWHKIRKNHIRKMNNQLSLATSLSETIDIRHIAVAEPGWQGCLSRPRRSRPLLSLIEDVTLSDFYLPQTQTIRANGLSPVTFDSQEIASQLINSEKWILSCLWLNECMVNTNVISEGTAGSMQLSLVQWHLNHLAPDARPMVERLWKREEQAMAFFMYELSCSRELWATYLIAQLVPDAGCQCSE